MKRTILSLVALLIFAGLAGADEVSSEQLTATTNVQSLTASIYGTLNPGGALPHYPTLALIQVNGGVIRCDAKTDAESYITSSKGLRIPDGGSVKLEGYAEIRNFRFIKESGTPVLEVVYSKP